MTVDQIERTIARRTGLNLAQNASDIRESLMSALEEYGTHIDVPFAQKLESLTIAASTNSVVLPTNTDRVLSVGYEYLSGSINYKIHLIGTTISAIDQMNEGEQGDTTDEISHYAVSGETITVGPLLVKTGGTLDVRYQRKLGIGDIPRLPNGAVLIEGAIGNLLPESDPNGDRARKKFEYGLIPAAMATEVIREEYSEISLPDHIIADDLYREGLN